MNKQGTLKKLRQLGSQPSISEENGLRFLSESDLHIFSPGISTGGFAEIRMAKDNPKRSIVATTIDQKGLAEAKRNIESLVLTDRIEAKYEDLREKLTYENGLFDFIYARLVLHYLSAQDLDKTLSDFHRVIKPGGRAFVVVRSDKNIPVDDPKVKFNDETKITRVPYYDSNGEINAWGDRYYHTEESISSHLERAGFRVVNLNTYTERLYKDFMRREPSSRLDNLIEILVAK